MLTVLKQIFFAEQSAAETTPYDDVQFAAAVLFLEAMHADHETTEQEQRAVDNGLRSLFDITAQQAAALREAAEQHFNEVTSLHQFITVVNRSFIEEQKIQIIEGMWRIAHADNILDKYEEHIIRRIAELLHVSHAQFIQAKHRSQANKGSDELVP